MQWRNIHLLLPPPPRCTGGCGEANTEGEQEVMPKLTCLRSRCRHQPSWYCCAGWGTHLNCSQPCFIYRCVWRGQEKLPPHPCTGHENGVHCSHPSDDVGAPPQLLALGVHSCTVRGVWNQRRGAGCWLPASSWLKWGFQWGPVCAALRAPPAALVPSRAGGQLCGDRRARAELGRAGAGAELWRCRGTGVVVGIGVAAGQAGGQRGRAVAGTAVLQQDVDALLAAGSPGIGQRGQAPSVPTLHIHSVLRGREAAGQWYWEPCARGQGAQELWGRQEEGAGRVGKSVPVGMWGNP